MYLNKMNPSVKALTILGLVLVLALMFDPITPLLFTVSVIIITFLFGTFRKKHYVLYLLPFIIFAFGMLWTTIAFADMPKNPGDTVNLIGWEVPREDLMVALSLSFRVLAFATLSLLFMFTTNMVAFLLSLMQQLKLPPKLAYGIMAGYRFLPMLKSEFGQIQAAHRVRGLGQESRWKRYRRFAVPLLAGAIRKAERTAVAMESKGFTGSRERTFYRNLSIRKKDWLFPAGMSLLLGLILFLSIHFGYFSWYQGQL
ncbi:energy-coupling factor transporter transmembrane protein EcfT [Pontibacillus yanchengensis]|uniref:Energy-coupling factor transporter transmembrane protein EcfT n=2 Tax=Pontibacillus yanchengensis TaxID=462910 RepID=A0ACC7VKN6_9BACI|nr:energy-coupling factor transporter transmembrane component T [Pontibacillus yanchengensis]MYL35023.1 energy-coupling factor transporter transmembrane protein EcfT [Pontibacillus yanchengensis]MYL55265.1 energy-coupling factor transporter transmembrane protein EcfT [Pontibacillus yanchengensis]